MIMMLEFYDDYSDNNDFMSYYVIIMVILYYIMIIHNHSLMASTDLLSYAICVSNRPPFSPHMSVPNKQMAYPAAAT